MKTRYFKHTNCRKNSEWKETSEGLFHRMDGHGWARSILKNSAELLEDECITETDADGNPLQP